MCQRRLDFTSRQGAHAIHRFDPVIDKLRGRGHLQPPRRVQGPDRGGLAGNNLLNRADLAGARIDDLRVEFQTFAHRGPRRHDRQISWLQPAAQLIEIAEARGDPLYRPLLLVAAIDALEAFLQDLADRQELLDEPAIGDTEHQLLRAVHQDLHVIFTFEAQVGDLRAGDDELAEHGLLQYDAGVVLDVGRGRHRVQQTGHVRGAADVVQLPFIAQAIGDGNQVHRLAAFEQFHHRFVDATVGVAIEILRPDQLHHAGDGVTVEQHRPEHALFRIEVLRGHALDRG